MLGILKQILDKKKRFPDETMVNDTTVGIPRAPMDRENYRENIVPPPSNTLANAEPPSQVTLDPEVAKVQDRVSMPSVPAPNIQPANARIMSPTEAEIKRRQGKDFSETRNEDGTYTYGKDRDKDHNWWDVVKGIALGFTKGGLGGAVAGGIRGGMDRNFDEKAGNAMALQGLYPQYQMEQGVKKAEDEEQARRMDARYKFQKASDDALKAIQERNRSAYDSIVADKKVTADEVKIAGEMGFPGLQEYDMTDRETYFDEQGVEQARPKFGMGAVPAPTGRVDAKEGTAMFDGLAMTPSQAAEKKVRREESQAQRDQSMTQFNETKRLEVEKANISNEMKYQDDVRRNIEMVATANAKILEGNQDAQGAYSRLQVAQQDYAEAVSAEEPEAAAKARANFDKALQDVYGSAGKVQGGKELIDGLKKAMPKRPKALSYSPQQSQRAGVPSKQSLISAMKGRGIKQGSPEWQRVLSKAGYE